jgi:5-hydroxyisourate hydrolase
MNHNPITTHILDTSSGKPAANIDVSLFILQDNNWQLLSTGKTNQDGRLTEWESDSWYLNLQPEQLFSTYKIIFDLDSYWKNQPIPAFYPSAEVCFRLQDTRHHHIPLLLSAFGYSTYRGS